MADPDDDARAEAWAWPAAAGGMLALARRPMGRWSALAAAAWKEGGANHIELLSAGVAFYTFLAFVPLLSSLVLGYGLFADPVAVVRHMDRLTELMPPEAAHLVGDQLLAMTEADSTATGLALAIAILIALYGASRGANGVMTALNVVYRVEEGRGMVRRTLTALAMTVGAVLVLAVAVVAVSVLNFLGALLPDLGGASRLLLKGAFPALTAVAVAASLAVLYRYGPNRRGARAWLGPGAALAALVWLAATWGFGFYVANFANYNATYGSLGAVIVFLTWLYLSAYIVLFGAQLNAVAERDPPPAPKPGPAPAAGGAAPSPGRLLARLGLLAILSGLLGRVRRPRRDTPPP